MDDFFNTLLDGFLMDNFLISSTKNRYPRLNIRKTEDDGYEIIASVPGLRKKDIKLSMPEPNILVIEVMKQKDKDGEYILKEIPYRYSKRVLQTKEPIDENSVKAEVKDGLLYIRFKNISPEEKTIPIL